MPTGTSMVVSTRPAAISCRSQLPSYDRSVPTPGSQRCHDRAAAFIAEARAWEDDSGASEIRGHAQRHRRHRAGLSSVAVGQPFLQQGVTDGKDDRSHKESDDPEREESSDDACKDEQQRELSPPADEERTKNVVDGGKQDG